MRSYKIAIIVVAVLLGGAGLGFVITGFATAGEMTYNQTINYDPSLPDPIEDLNINADIGKIIVLYNNSATPHYAKIEVSMKISGLFMSGKVYTDFYKPSSEWWDESTHTFSLEALPGFWFDPSHWFVSYNINVTVTLRTDVIYDLKAVSATGSVDMYVPANVVLNQTVLQSSTGSVYMQAVNTTFDSQVRLSTSTGSVLLNAQNVMFNDSVSMTTSTGGSEIYATNTEFTEGAYFETSTGSLTLNFTSCIMGDNIVGQVSTGSIVYKSYNMVYAQDISINLETSTGGIDAFIFQYINMNATVTSQMTTSTGSINFLYIDTVTNLGVRFVSSTSTGSINYVADPTMDILGSVYESLNYGLASQKYTFTLTTSTGSVSVDGESAQPAPP